MRYQFIKGLMLVLVLASPSLLNAQNLQDDAWLEKSRELLKKAEKTEVPEWLRIKPTEKDLEAAKMVAEQSGQEPRDVRVEDELASGTVFLFGSFSMPERTLRNMLDEATQNGVVFVLRGLAPGTNIPGTLKRLKSLLNDIEKPANVIIDPTLYQRFNITVVPTLVLTRKKQEPVFVRGPVTVEWFRRRAGALALDQSNDLGQRGETYEIAEIDFIKEMQRRVTEIDWEEKKVAAVKNFWKKQPYIDLPAARRDREFLVDLTVEVQKDVMDGDGRIIVRKGDLVNPLDLVPVTKTIMVFNGTDKRQIEQISSLAAEIRKQGRGVVLITTTVDRSDGWSSMGGMETDLQGPVYLLQKDLAERLHLEFVPSVIRTQGNKLLVKELGVGG